MTDQNARCLACGQVVRERTAAAVTSPRTARAEFAPIADKDSEHFAVLTLNTRNEPLRMHVVSVGSLNVAALQPRDVIRPALLDNAAAVIVAHNHPSGDPTPSPEDLAVTRHLREACQLVGLDLLDHLVIARDRFVSLREKGAL